GGWGGQGVGGGAGGDVDAEDGPSASPGASWLRGRARCAASDLIAPVMAQSSLFLQELMSGDASNAAGGEARAAADRLDPTGKRLREAAPGRNDQAANPAIHLSG